MGTHRIIEGSAFGPDVLKVIASAFEEAWVEIADKFSPGEQEDAREQLAQAIIAAARGDTHEVSTVRDAGIRAKQSKYPSLFDGLPLPSRDTSVS
jgi:hypothetical protein